MESSGVVPTIVVIGNFDGVHLGHQAVLADAERRGAAGGLTPVSLTFHPHPMQALGRAAPPVLTALARKLELIARVGPAVRALVVPFDLPFAAQTPEEFAERVLAGRLGAREVVVGQNFRFGRGREGDFETLRRLGAGLGFSTRSFALIEDGGGPLSSTRIRDAVAVGELEDATRMLGRPHMLSGTVVKGDQRGRLLGFPTCNLAGIEEALPANGVYAVLVDRTLEDAASSGPATALAKGVANVGVRPTVARGEARPSVEVHLLDHTEELYGARLRVHLSARLRPEQRFSGLAALTEQIGRDVTAARAALATAQPDPLAGGAWR